MSKSFLSGIYYIKNKITGEYYIGQTNNLNARKQQHFNELKKNTHTKKLQDSFNKYGECNFEFKIIDYAPIEYLNDLEEEYISIYDSIENGFNQGYRRFCGSRNTEIVDWKIISIKQSTKQALYSIGKKGETFDEVVRRLLINYNESITFENINKDEKQK